MVTFFKNLAITADNYRALWCPRHYAELCLLSPSFLLTLLNKNNLEPHFANEEPKAQRGKVTCLRPYIQRWQIKNLYPGI